MHRLLIIAVCVAGAYSAIAAEDLSVLKPGPQDTPPRKLLQKQLLAECQSHFDIRKAEVEKLKTPEDIVARQTVLREKFIAALGGFPAKSALNAQVVGTLKRDGYRVEKVIYESQPQHHVTANLYIPEGNGPFPGVIMPIGHSSNGKAADYMQRAAILLARNGFVALVYDPIGQGERSQLLDKLGNPAIKGSTSEHTMVGVGALLVGRSTATYRIWDGIRSIDYLVSRPEVDATKIGCTGCSGGGTLTSYLMALDDRIAAAAPSCYLTSLERLFATLGPQDAEQNITGQVALGLDHADYIFLRAPNPTIILASTKDFFDIQGTWDTFREAKRIYTKLGFPERIEIIEADNTHGYPKLHREAMARFFTRWLKGEVKTIVEENWPIEKDADLWCTRSGQVLEDFKGKSVFDLNAALADALTQSRFARKNKPEDFRTEIARSIGLPKAIPPMQLSEVGTVKRDNIRIQKAVIQAKGGLPIPAIAFAPTNEKAKSPVILCVHDRGAAVAAEPGGVLEKLAGQDRRAVAIDLQGFGETAVGVAAPEKVPPFGVEFKESMLAFHLNQPLLGRRTADLLAVVDEARTERDVELVGYGTACPTVLHAAALVPEVKAVTIDGGLVSWDNVLRTPISNNQLVNVVPGVLRVYDLPDLAATLAPRPLTIRNPVNAAGRPLSKEEAEEAYKHVRAAYKAANAMDKLVIEAGGK